MDEKPGQRLWLIVGHLLRDLSLGRWREARVWAKSLINFITKLGGGSC